MYGPSVARLLRSFLSTILLLFPPLRIGGWVGFSVGVEEEEGGHLLGAGISVLREVGRLGTGSVAKHVAVNRKVNI